MVVSGNFFIELVGFSRCMVIYLLMCRNELTVFVIYDQLKQKNIILNKITIRWIDFFEFKFGDP